MREQLGGHLAASQGHPNTETQEMLAQFRLLRQQHLCNPSSFNAVLHFVTRPCHSVSILLNLIMCLLFFAKEQPPSS